jgi:hypothetical protein
MAPIDPSVWTGRALQAESDDLEGGVLRFCIRPVAERLFPANMDIRALDFIRVSAPKATWATLITNALARPFLHLLNSTRKPRRESHL